MENSDKDGNQFRLLKTIPNTEDQENELRFLQLAGDFDPYNPSPLPPSPRELSCIDPPEWINGDLTLDLGTWAGHVQPGSNISGISDDLTNTVYYSTNDPNHPTSDENGNSSTVDSVADDNNTDYCHSSPLDWATNLILLDLTMPSSGVLDLIVKQRIKIREDLNRVMIRTLTEANVCPIDKLGPAGLKLLCIDGTVMTCNAIDDPIDPRGSIDSDTDGYGSIEIPGLALSCYDSHVDHKEVMVMVSDSIKTAYSITPVQRLGDLRETTGWESLELRALSVLDSMRMGHGDTDEKDLEMVEDLLDVLIPVFCPDASKCLLMLGALSNALPARIDS